MKKFLYALLITSLSVVSAQAANMTVEPGYYEAVEIEEDGSEGDINTQMEIYADGTVWFDVQTAKFSMPEPGCSGTWTVEGTMFLASLECPIFLLPYIDVSIDITNVSPSTVRSELGAEVFVQLDIMGKEPRLFRLKRVENQVQPLN